MVGADQPVAAIAARTVGQARAAMATDIVKAAHHAVGAAQRQEFFSQDIERVIVAGPRDIVDVADQMPGLRKQLEPLRLEEFGVAIKARREALAGIAANGPLSERHEVCTAECRAKPS